jgi:hypothetical protein
MRHGAEKTLTPAGAHRKAISYPGAFAPGYSLCALPGRDHSKMRGSGNINKSSCSAIVWTAEPFRGSPPEAWFTLMEIEPHLCGRISIPSAPTFRQGISGNRQDAPAKAGHVHGSCNRYLRGDCSEQRCDYRIICKPPPPSSSSSRTAGQRTFGDHAGCDRFAGLRTI